MTLALMAISQALVLAIIAHIRAEDLPNSLLWASRTPTEACIATPPDGVAVQLELHLLA
jgi:hypothetical protein